MSEPTTEAGRMLVEAWRKDRLLTDDETEAVVTIVLGIEQQAAAATKPADELYREALAEIITEFDRLAPVLYGSPGHFYNALDKARAALTEGSGE